LRGLAVSGPQAVAVGVVAVALGGAVYFGSLHLGVSRPGAWTRNGGGLLDLLGCAHPTRAFWQFPVAVVIAALGVAGALGVLKRT
jgi:hypothetical protein